MMPLDQRNHSWNWVLSITSLSSLSTTSPPYRKSTRYTTTITILKIRIKTRLLGARLSLSSSPSTAKVVLRTDSSPPPTRRFVSLKESRLSDPWCCPKQNECLPRPILFLLRVQHYPSLLSPLTRSYPLLVPTLSVHHHLIAQKLLFFGQCFQDISCILKVTDTFITQKLSSSCFRSKLSHYKLCRSIKVLKGPSWWSQGSLTLELANSVDSISIARGFDLGGVHSGSFGRSVPECLLCEM